MKINQGHDVLIEEKNRVLQPGIFISFVDDKKKAIIFIGSGYKTVLVKKIFPATRMNIEKKAEELKHLRKLFRERNRQLMPDEE